MILWLNILDPFLPKIPMVTAYLDFASFAFLALFFIIDPVGNIPLFLAMTQHDQARERELTIRKACLTAASMLIFFLLTGNFILNLFHITIESFRIAGGIVLFIISMQMLFIFRPGQKTSPKEEQEAIQKEDVSIFPLAIPLLCGPGALTTIVLLRGLCRTVTHYALICAVIIVVSIVTYVILRESQHLMKWLGQTGINIMTRLMGLILSVIAVQFALDGIKGLIPQLLKPPPPQLTPPW